MPRISAESVAAHVANQQEAVVDAAVKLFIERGFERTSIGDIAREVGLARSSMYRYMPDKSHLLVLWYYREIPLVTADWKRTLEVTDSNCIEPSAENTPGVNSDRGPADARRRLRNWAISYLAYAKEPQHVLIGALMAVLPNINEQTRNEVSAMHAEMMSVVGVAVKEAGVPEEEVGPVVGLLAGLVLAAAKAEADSGSNEQLRTRLTAAVDALVD